MARIDTIRRKYPDSLLLSLPGVAKAKITANQVFNAAVSADPTPQKKMVGWILDVWKRKSFQWEDIRAGENSTLHTTLHDFDRLKKFITKPDGTPDVSARSLMKYKTPGDLWLAIKDILVREQEEGETLTGKAQKALDKMKARIESYRKTFESGMVIDVPFTEFSSKLNGRGTRWCTAADKDNIFESYAERGPLIIITLPSGHKYQYHVDIIEAADYSEIPDAISDILDDDEIPYADDVMQRIFQYDFFSFMDEADKEISAKDRKILRPYLEDIISFSARVSADMFGEFITNDEHNSTGDYSLLIAISALWRKYLFPWKQSMPVSEFWKRDWKTRHTTRKFIQWLVISYYLPISARETISRHIMPALLQIVKVLRHSGINRNQSCGRWS